MSGYQDVVLEDLFDTPDANATDEAVSAVSSSGQMLPALEQGDTMLRMLPPPKRQDGSRVSLAWEVTSRHYIEFRDRPKAVVFNCPNRMAQRVCPACEKLAELRSTGKQSDYQLAANFLPSIRCYAIVINRAKPEEGPKIWAFGKKIHEQLSVLLKRTNFTHPLSGYDLIINRAGVKRKTVYRVDMLTQSTPLARHEETMIEWLMNRPSLDDLIVVPTAEAIVAQIQGETAPAMGGNSQTAALGSGASVDPAMFRQRTGSTTY